MPVVFVTSENFAEVVLLFLIQFRTSVEKTDNFTGSLSLVLLDFFFLMRIRYPAPTKGLISAPDQAPFYFLKT